VSILAEIVRAKRARVAAMRRERSASALAVEESFSEPRRSLAAALRRPEGEPIRFLCEIKRASPSAGAIRLDADARGIARAYREAGAAGVSLVTEEDFFRGRPADLPVVRAEGLPVLMKDFLVDPWQVVQARALGADAVLLLLALGDRTLLAELRAAAREQGIEVLAEIHASSELEAALALDPEMIGVNHRDLSTFEVDLARGIELLPHLPAERVRLAESGIRERGDVVRLETAGFDALLVGESLMRLPDPGAGLRALRGAETDGRGTAPPGTAPPRGESTSSGGPTPSGRMP
jgi:indole-3-glycerol phosphate synthase